MLYRLLLSILQPKTPVLAVLAMLLLAPAGGIADDATAPPEREPAPSMLSPLVDETGAAFTMADISEDPVLVNFWATWCVPCVVELPALARAAAALANDEVTVFLVSVDRGGAQKALPFLETHGVSGVALGFDPKAKLSREVGVRGLPTTLLLDAGQRSAWRFVGPFEWDESAMLAMIRGLLDS